MLNQALSILGAVLVLIAYGGLQLGRLDADTVAYQIMNLIGGLLLFIAAVVLRQFGFMLMEGAWALMSVVGLVRVIRRR